MSFSGGGRNSSFGPDDGPLPPTSRQPYGAGYGYCFGQAYPPHPAGISCWYIYFHEIFYTSSFQFESRQSCLLHLAALRHLSAVCLLTLVHRRRGGRCHKYCLTLTVSYCTREMRRDPNDTCGMAAHTVRDCERAADYLEVFHLSLCFQHWSLEMSDSVARHATLPIAAPMGCGNFGHGVIGGLHAYDVYIPSRRLIAITTTTTAIPLAWSST